MRLILSICILMLGLTSCDNAKTAETVTKAMDEVKEVVKPEKLLRHVVLFKFKEDADPAGIKKVEEAFHALPSKIDAIYDYEWGVNNSPEGLNKGLTHCFFVTFKSEEDREIYLPHPDHKAFVEVLGPVLDDVTVVDYWTGG